jgi:hypothetical protein
MTQFGPKPAEISRSGWTSGWDVINAIEIAGDPHLVSFKPASGAITIDKVRADLSGTDPVLGSTWSTGWTSIVPLQLGGDPFLLLYKSVTGRAEIDAITNNGQDVNTLTALSWTTGWTTILPFTIAGDQYIFSYKNASGAVAIDKARSDGSGTDSVLGSTWAPGWTNFGVWEQPSWGALLVSYNSVSGALEVDRILDLGENAETVLETIVPTSQRFVPFTFHGEPVFMMYDGSGNATFRHPFDPGPLATVPPLFTSLQPTITTIGRAKWNPGWQSLTPFQLSGQPCWLAYNGNDAVLDRID